MYRYTWFDKKNYTKDIIPVGKRQADWISFQYVSTIFLSAWEEHCLECSEPGCYGSCKYWIERFDKKCKKTFYGLRKRNDLLQEFPMAVQFKFQPWAKIQTIIFRGNIREKKYLTMNKIWFILDRLSFFLSEITKPIFPNYKIGRIEEVLKNCLLKKINGIIYPKFFLFQCFSEEGEPYQMFFELLKDDVVFFRDSTQINKGYNQLIIRVPKIDWKNDGNYYVRYYPEDNKEVEILVIFSDFITIKNEYIGSGKLSQAELLTSNLGGIESNVFFPAKKVKCVAWDLDNTIWNGILIESNPDSLDIRPGILDVIKRLDERGIIQIIVSKNDDAEVIPVLDRLGIKDFFVYIIANWQQKSKNLLFAAENLNINIDTFALVDDSQFERGEVRDRLPQVRTYNEKEALNLLELEEFDVPITEDAKKRRTMYQEEAKRKRIKSGFFGTEVDFIRSCEMCVTITQIHDGNKQRSLELVQRTNQLNLSGRKYSDEIFSELVNNNKNRCFALYCKDKYGDYGQVGFILIDFNLDNTALIVKEYAISCRVAEKWIEPTLLYWMKEKWLVDRVVFKGVYNKKNDRLIYTLKRFGMKEAVIEKKDTNDILLSINGKDIAFEKAIKIIDKTA